MNISHSQGSHMNSVVVIIVIAYVVYESNGNLKINSISVHYNYHQLKLIYLISLRIPLLYDYIAPSLPKKYFGVLN